MAVFPVAGGHPDYSSDSTSGYLPLIFSGKTVAKFYDASVVAAISNTDYEGEISSMNDKVKIRTVPDININNYSMGQNLVYQRPESTLVELKIDQGKSWSFVVDDVAGVQSDLDLMDMWSSEAAERLKVVIDRDCLANLVVDPAIATTNKGATAGRISASYNLGTTGSPVAYSTTNAVSFLTELSAVLSEAAVPEVGRWVVLPTWAGQKLKNSDLKQANFTGDATSPMRSGLIGQIDGMDIYVSNNLPVVGVQYNIIAGIRESYTFAMQLSKSESLRAESTFGTLVRGLSIYGRKVIKGDAIALATVTKA